MGHSPPNAFDRVLDDTYAPLRRLMPAGFAPGLLAGIDAGLAVRAKDRPQSIADWRAKLSMADAVLDQVTVVQAQHGSDPAATVQSPLPQPNKSTRADVSRAASAGRKRISPWAGAAAVAVTVLAGGGYGVFVAMRPPTVSTAAQNLTAEELTRALEERHKADALAEEKKKLEEEAQRRAETDAEAKRKADEALLAAQQQRQKAEEELAKLKADMESRRQAEAIQREQAAAAAQRALEEAGKGNEAAAEMAALRKAEADAKQMAAADAAAKQQADEVAQQKAEAEAAALRKAEEDAQKKAVAEAETKRQADEALAKAQAERQRADEEAAKQKAEADAKAAEARQQAEAEAKQKDEADAKAQAKAKADADAKKAEAEAKQKADAEARAKADAEAAAVAEKKVVEAAEAGLRLSVLDRQRLQVALTSLGFDTRGSDGVFGPRSREMIAGWQKAHNQSATGFLSMAQQQALLKDAAPAISKYDDDQKKIEQEKKKAEEEARKKAEEEAKKKAEDEAKAKAATIAPLPTPATAVQPAQVAPSLAVTPSDGGYDGNYAGSMSVSTPRPSSFVWKMTLQVSNGSATGTINSNTGCIGSNRVSIKISAAGDVSGETVGWEAGSCSPINLSIRGRVGNGTMQLTLTGPGTRASPKLVRSGTQ
jgi:peptidoglycan hydrolase-like protein with peptidoglycan-binding domain